MLIKLTNHCIIPLQFKAKRTDNQSLEQ